MNDSIYIFEVVNIPQRQYNAIDCFPLYKKTRTCQLNKVDIMSAHDLATPYTGISSGTTDLANVEYSQFGVGRTLQQ